MTDFDVGMTSAITINNAGGWTLDEIRVGTAFADVAPAAVPAPPAALLLVTGLMLVGVTRSRRN